MSYLYSVFRSYGQVYTPLESKQIEVLPSTMFWVVFLPLAVADVCPIFDPGPGPGYVPGTHVFEQQSCTCIMTRASTCSNTRASTCGNTRASTCITTSASTIEHHTSMCSNTRASTCSTTRASTFITTCACRCQDMTVNIMPMFSLKIIHRLSKKICIEGINVVAVIILLF